MHEELIGTLSRTMGEKDETKRENITLQAQIKTLQEQHDESLVRQRDSDEEMSAQLERSQRMIERISKEMSQALDQQEEALESRWQEERSRFIAERASAQDELAVVSEKVVSLVSQLEQQMLENTGVRNDLETTASELSKVQ